MDIYIISTIVGIVLSTIAIIEKFKGAFDLFNPISRRLKKYLTYNEKYSSYYDVEIQNYLKHQIKYLSLFSLTSVKEENAQLVYFGILQENMKAKINLSLLSDILNAGCIHEDKFIEINSLESYKSKTDFKRKIIYYGFLIYLVINNLVIVPVLSLYRIFILEINISVSKIVSSILLLVITLALIKTFRRIAKPISKKELSKILKIIDNWNRKIRPESIE